MEVEDLNKPRAGKRRPDGRFTNSLRDEQISEITRAHKKYHGNLPKMAMHLPNTIKTIRKYCRMLELPVYGQLSTKHYEKSFLENIILDKDYSITEATNILGLKRTRLHCVWKGGLINLVEATSKGGLKIKGAEIIRYYKRPKRDEYSFKETINAIPGLTKKELNNIIDSKKISKRIFTKNGNLSRKFVAILYAEKTMDTKKDISEEGLIRINDLYPDTSDELNELIRYSHERSILGVLDAFKLPLYLAAKDNNYNMENVSGEGLREIIKKYDLKEYHAQINTAYGIGIEFVDKAIRDKETEKISSALKYLDDMIESLYNKEELKVAGSFEGKH